MNRHLKCFLVGLIPVGGVAIGIMSFYLLSMIFGEDVAGYISLTFFGIIITYFMGVSLCQIAKETEPKKDMDRPDDPLRTYPW